MDYSIAPSPFPAETLKRVGIDEQVRVMSINRSVLPVQQAVTFTAHRIKEKVLPPQRQKHQVCPKRFRPNVVHLLSAAARHRTVLRVSRCVDYRRILSRRKTV